MNWTAAASTVNGGGTTPANLTLSAVTTGLGAGVYQGTVTITVAGAEGSPATVSSRWF